MKKRKKILCVASAGGHWLQLLRLRPAWSDHDQVFVTTLAGCKVDGAPTYVVTDANRHTKLKMLKLAIQLLFIVLRQRPDVVISTGAAPGYLAVRLGRWLGARTIWVDSVANVECLSLSGKWAGKFVDMWLTQWPDLAGPKGPCFEGSVL